LLHDRRHGWGRDHCRHRGVRQGFGAAPDAGHEGGGALIMRGLEFGAAGLVLWFGVDLLLGYITAERVTCL
jgi:nickel/cobalt exporter